jgi:hypothetical protein
LSAPVASDGGGGLLLWVYPYADPDHWDIEESADGVTGWSIVDTEPGSSRDANAGDTSVYQRVRGYDPGGTPLTLYSNVVFLA